MSSSDCQLIDAVEPEKQQMVVEAKKLIKEYFPRKIKELDALIKSDPFKLDSDVSKQPDVQISEPPSSDATKMCESKCQTECDCPVLYPGGPIDCNPRLQEIFDALLPHFHETLETMETIKLGLSLLVPKIEDGNNTGVAIQNKAMTKITALRDVVYGRFDSYANIVEHSGSLIARIVRYPHSRHYRMHLKIYEDNKRREMVLWARWLRFSLVNNHDYFVKNWNKIVQPRGASNHESMY